MPYKSPFAARAPAAVAVFGNNAPWVRAKIKRWQFLRHKLSYFEKGETVEVVTEQAMGIKAVVWAYVLPFLSVMTALLVLLQAGAGELVSGLTSLGILALYYCVLYLLRHRLEKEITFKVRKTS